MTPVRMRIIFALLLVAVLVARWNWEAGLLIALLVIGGQHLVGRAKKGEPDRA